MEKACGKMFPPYPEAAPRVRMKCGTVGLLVSDQKEEPKYCEFCRAKISLEKEIKETKTYEGLGDAVHAKEETNGK